MITFLAAAAVIFLIAIVTTVVSHEHFCKKTFALYCWFTREYVHVTVVPNLRHTCIFD